jgi:hypothetical protein
VRAIDGAGNIDLSPATHVWEIVAPTCPAPTMLVANADSWIDSGSPTANKGTDSSLMVQSKIGQNTRALVGFPFPVLPQGCAVQSATLTMFADAAVAGRTLQALRITGAWTESAVTFSNQPGTTGSAATTTSGVGNRQWNVTGQVQEMYTAGLHLGFLIRDALESLSGGAEQKFDSKETNRNTATLALTFAVSAIRAPDTSEDPAPEVPPAPPLSCGAPVTVQASADAWIDQNSPKSNKGKDTILNVRSKVPRDNFRALVQFPLPEAPTGCVMDSATLRLYAAGVQEGRTLHALRVASPWSEDRVTWENQPGTRPGAAAAASGLGYIDWTVTSQIEAIVSSGANYGLMIRDAQEDGDAAQQFHARDKGSHPPQLVITYRPAN